MTAPALSTLPSEVLHHIAVNLEVDGCLKLARTCRPLRAATLDALLLREVIGTQHTLWNFHSLNLIRIAQRLNHDANILERYRFFAMDPRRLGHWDKVAFNKAIQRHFDLDLDVWARYAVADLRAFRLCTELNSQVDMDGRGKYGFVNDAAFEKSMRYLPHILALKHPSIHASGLAPALATQVVKIVEAGNGEVHTTVKDRLAFSYCATMLSQDSAEVPLFGCSNPRAAMNAFFTSRCRDFAQRLASTTTTTTTPPLPNDAADAQAHARHQATRMTSAEAHIIIGAFSSLLRHAFREYRVRRLIGADYYTFILPFALDVPMDYDTGNSPPLPFTDSTDSASPPSSQPAWETWHIHHLFTMTSFAFLASDEWVGCYSYTYPNTPEIDAPMVGIAFSFEVGCSDDEASAIYATGRDSIGDFTLYGHVERSGHASLVKEYDFGKRWEWNCCMTPFGIGGVWGPPGSAIVNGSVWLWKKVWTEARAR